MSIKINSSCCDKCGTCIAVCQCDSISMQEKSVFIDSKKCSGCGFCVNVCPVSALSVDK